MLLSFIPMLTLALIFNRSYLIRFGISLSILVWLRFGGKVLIQHYALRFLLAKNGLLPMRLKHSLDHLVEQKVLIRRGGRYSLVATFIQKYLANQNLESEAERRN